MALLEGGEWVEYKSIYSVKNWKDPGRLSFGEVFSGLPPSAPLSDLSPLHSSSDTLAATKWCAGDSWAGSR
ncbi:UNVERIFIED_CONTAM: hypothetical protein RMT77_014557 [Armadillidium vulgare]